MSPFVPPEPPITPEDGPVPTLDVPLPPPEVGFGSPWVPADAENRDRILDWWRMWWRRVFFPWLKLWIAYWNNQWKRLIEYLNKWMLSVEDYITKHAVNGHSWWKTTTAIKATGLTTVVLPYEQYRPILIGDLVSDTSEDVRYGQVVALVDATHATVTPIGTLRGLLGPSGAGWWTTATPLSTTAPTTATLTADPTRSPQVGDLVIDSTPNASYGRISQVTGPLTAVVNYIGTLRGPAGIADEGLSTMDTGTLAAGAVKESRITGQPQMVGAFQLTTTAPSWVRVYASQAYMVADRGRAITTPLDIADDHGCYLDFVGIPSELNKVLTPGIMFTDIGQGLWLSVTNTGPAPASIRTTFNFRIFRQ